MGALHDDPVFLGYGDSCFIEESFGFRTPKHHLAQIDSVVQNGSDGGGVPVEGLSPVVAVFVVIGIVLIEVGLRVQNIALPQVRGPVKTPPCAPEDILFPNDLCFFFEGLF